MQTRLPPVVSAFVLTLACGFLVAAPVLSQSRTLPKANFPTYARPSGQQLPSMQGLHLTPGLDRRPNAPAEMYHPGEPKLNGALVRWETHKMPLRIWISPGLQLPEVPFNALEDMRVEQVSQMLRDIRLMQELPQCKGWTPTANEIVASGFEQWRQFENEGIFSFGFVDDPRDAQILVFFTDRFAGSEGPGGTCVHGITFAKMLPADEVRRWEAERGRSHPQWPIVMELVLSEDYLKLQAEAAHEFGHALGIKAHSPYRQDLMHENRMVDSLSPADKATIRWLYRQQTPYIY